MTIPIGPVSPFFIVEDVRRSANYYRDRLGFSIDYLVPDDEPFLAIVKRNEVRIFLKAVSSDVKAMPNRDRHAWAPWDAFVYVEDPQQLASEFVGRGAALHTDVTIRDDGLRGFELQDVDGYVLFFGRPEP